MIYLSMEKDDYCVDAETLNALLRLKEDIIKAVTDIIKSENAALENNINKIYGLRLEFIEREQARSFKHHEEHFIEFKSVHKRIDNLEQRQSTDEGTQVGKEKASAQANNKKNILIGVISLCVAIVFGVVGFVLGG